MCDQYCYFFIMGVVPNKANVQIGSEESVGTACQRRYNEVRHSPLRIIL